MWTFFTKVLEQYGLIAAIVVALMTFIVWEGMQGRKERKCTQKTHKAERDEWRVSDNDKFKTIIDSSNKNTQVLEGLKTVIEARSQRRD